MVTNFEHACQILFNLLHHSNVGVHFKTRHGIRYICLPSIWVLGDYLVLVEETCKIVPMVDSHSFKWRRTISQWYKFIAQESYPCSEETSSTPWNSISFVLFWPFILLSKNMVEVGKKLSPLEVDHFLSYCKYCNKETLVGC